MSKRIAFFICIIGIMAFSACQNINIEDDTQAETPTFDALDGTYVAPKTIIITSSTADAVIRYTLDGTAPSKTAGTLYAGPIVLSATGIVTIKAVAYTDALLASSVGVAIYTILPLTIAAPSTVTASPANASVSIAWTTVDGATGYNIYYKAGTSVAKTDMKAAGSPYTTSPATISGLTNGTTYAFIVTAYDEDGESVASTVTTATPAVFIPQPDPPILNTLTVENGKTTVSWSEVTVAASYTLYWKQAASVSQSSYGAILQDIPSTTLSKSINLTNGIIYSFVVTATNAGGQSIDSNIMTITPGVPGAPTNLVATAKGPTEIEITWSAPTTGSALVTGYNLYRYSVASTPPASPNYTGVTSPFSDVTSINGGDNFYYSIKATSVAGAGCDSSFSAEVSVTTPTGTPPNAPTSLAVNSVGDGTVTLGWVAPTGDYPATSYKIYYKLGTTVSKTDPLSTTSTLSPKSVTGLTNTQQYAFIVTGINAFGEGAASGIVTGTPIALPGAPGATATAHATLKQIAVAITAPGTGGIPTSYKLYRGTTSNGQLPTALATGLSVGTYTDTAVSLGTTYYYKATAINVAGEGPSSTETSAFGSVPPSPNITLFPNSYVGLATYNNEYQVAGDSSLSISSTNSNTCTLTRNGGGTTTLLSGSSTFHVNSDPGPFTSGQTVTYAGFTANAWGTSPAAATKAFTFPTNLLQSTLVTVAYVSSSSVTVTWNSVTDANFYYIYRSTSSSGPWGNPVGQKASSPITLTGLGAGTYWYAVVGITTATSPYRAGTIRVSSNSVTN